MTEALTETITVGCTAGQPRTAETSPDVTGPVRFGPPRERTRGRRKLFEAWPLRIGIETGQRLTDFRDSVVRNGDVHGSNLAKLIEALNCCRILSAARAMTLSFTRSGSRSGFHSMPPFSVL